MKYLKEQDKVIVNYDETLVRKIIEKVIVYENNFTVEFKTGINLDMVQ